MKVNAIVQARVGSERLPGKVLARIRGKTLIDRVLERVASARRVSRIILAVPNTPEDEALVRYWPLITRGDPKDLLGRFTQAAEEYPADSYVRITADCPLIDPVVIDEVIESFILSKADYASNTLERSYPRGFDVEVFTHQLLLEAAEKATTPWEREHVTPYMYREDTEDNLVNVTWKNDESLYRLCVDTQEDLRVIEAILNEIEPLNPMYGVEEVVAFCKTHPEVMLINSDVKQRENQSWN